METGVVAGIRLDKVPQKFLEFSGLDTLKAGQPLICVDPQYFRPTEVESLLGDPGKARELLGWRPETSFEELVLEMTAHDMEEAARDAFTRNKGFHTPRSFEERM